MRTNFPRNIKKVQKKFSKNKSNTVNSELSPYLGMSLRRSSVKSSAAVAPTLCRSSVASSADVAPTFQRSSVASSVAVALTLERRFVISWT